MTRGGNLIAFDLAGDQPTAFAFLNRLNLAKISNNLGDTKTLITHPATTTHQKLSHEARAELGISGASLRISVGLEDSADLIEDLEQAFDHIGHL